jgi:hypothetical protein
MNNKKLQVWWIPQVPGKPFYVSVNSVQEAAKIIRILADYDAFQFDHNIRPDYASVGGLLQWDEDSDGEGKGNAGWVSWYDEETGIDDPEEYIETLRIIV